MISSTDSSRGPRRLGAALALVLSACAPDAALVELESGDAVLVASDGDLVLPIPLDVAFDGPRAALGERLFRDPALSHDGTVSCTSCHDLAGHGGADGLRHSELPGRPVGPINVPTVFNVGLNFRWSWSGRWLLMSDQIDAAMRAPHAMATSVDDAVPLIEPTYAVDFARVYPDGLTAPNVRDALTEYLHSLTTPNARFDRFLRGDDAAITEDERRGWALFREIGCVSCHQGVNIGGNLYQRFGVIEDYVALDGEISTADEGLAGSTHEPQDRFVFRVPSLRNVELTAPYFHDGSAPTLEAAVQTMARHQLGRPLRHDQAELLVAFLRTLTGEQPARRAP
jgi:cytochrome c peroxidase